MAAVPAGAARTKWVVPGPWVVVVGVACLVEFGLPVCRGGCRS
ncbi:MAG: hypothetical protein ACT4PP_10375 [Sporichthyaceae bacterium]